MDMSLAHYASLLDSIKDRVRLAQTKATLSANRQMLELYWDIGRLIHGQQEVEGWGAGVLRRLAEDLKNELSGVRGFSERNLRRMSQFYRSYPGSIPIGPQAVAKLTDAGNRPQAVADFVEGEDEILAARDLAFQLPWGHNILLLQNVKEISTRCWYMQQTLEHGWSRHILDMMIQSRAHERQGVAITNFEASLPAARQALKDPYVFDFLTIDGTFRERELEAGLVTHIERFLLELGVGFAFIGRQHHIPLGKDDFYLDLLFYHLKLRCFVVIDLKIGPFKPDYAGKMNFYLNLVDDTMRHEHDDPSIGLILCQDKKQILAEYALRGMDKPIGVSEYELTRALPDELKSSLPTIADIEAELSGTEGTDV
jgi:predicted nuclease of restriction endonuclease-like (RecB) superfamily